MTSIIQTEAQRGSSSSNSAADFVKLHGQEALGGQVGLVEDTTYDVELDKFLPTAELISENHYETSAKTLEDFKKTLETFKKTLRKNRVDQKLNIELKDQYGFEDVVNIATRLKNRNEGDDSVSTCMTKIKSAFRSIGNRKGVLANLLSFAPNDSYGIVFCGGFTVILGAIDRADTLREELYAVISEIPSKMSNVHHLVDVYKKGNAALHKSADAVYVAMFSLLTIVINRLSKGVARKLSGLMLNGKEYGKDVKEAKKELDSRFEDFNEQAQLCAQRRLARTEDSVQNIEMAMQKLGGSLTEVKEIFAEQIEKSALVDAQKTQQLAYLTALTQNALYGLCGSSELFNPKSGALNEAEARVKGLLTAGHPTVDPRLPSHSLVSKTTTKLGKTWLKKARHSGTEHISDMAECLEAAEAFSHDDKAQIMSAMQSEEVSTWFRHSGSCLLTVEPHISPEEVLNPVSFVSALITRTLKSADTSLVLTVFCGLRAEESTEESISGPLGLVTQLNAQLIRMILDGQLTVDLSILRRSNFESSFEVEKHALKLLKKLLELALAAQDKDGTIYLVIDGLSSMTGDEEHVHAMVRKVLSNCQDVCEEAEYVLKVIISDPTHEVLEDESLDIDRRIILPMGVPVAEFDDVDSDDLKQEASLTVENELRSKRNRRRGRPGTDSSDYSDSDSEED